MTILWGAGAARATACTGDTWTGATNTDWFTASNWSAGVPSTSTVVCIPAGSFTVVINGETESKHSAAAASALGVGAGDTLELEGFDDGGTQYPATLAVSTNGGSIASGGEILMTAGCASSCPGGATSTFNIQHGTFTNHGAITATAGTEGSSPSARSIFGDLDNQGTVNVDVPIYVPGSGSKITNDTGGSITNNGGTSDLALGDETTFVEANGTTSPKTNDPANPAVVIDASGFVPTPSLEYTGSGASAIVIRNQANLSGNLTSGQSLVIDGTTAGCGSEAVATGTSDFTNAGTITLSGIGCSSLQFPGHTLTNTGTIVAAATAAGVSREVKGSVSSSGTLEIKGATAFDGSGATLTQTTPGTTTVGPGQILDLTGSTGNFDLEGGLLQSPGSSAAHQTEINAALDNSGGTVTAGTSTTPGDMAVDGHYTQGAHGRLTSVVAGTTAGSGYSQLAVAGGSTIGGTLDIVTHSGFKPSLNSLFTVIGGSSQTGTFSTLIGQFPPEGAFPPGWTFGYKPLYQSDNATLEAEGAAGLRVLRAGAGSGSVISAPTGVNCGSTCVSPFFNTQTVSLTAHPVTGWAFQGWSGAPGCGQAATCKVAMTQARTVTATFGHPTSTKLAPSANPALAGKPVTYTATVSPTPNGGTVEFIGNGAPISGCAAVSVSTTTGRATCTVTYKYKGTRTVKAVYSGNASFVHSTSSALTESVTG